MPKEHLIAYIIVVVVLGAMIVVTLLKQGT